MDWKKEPIYPIEPWDITETEFKIETNYRNETVFALSNGYIGTRGTLEEGYGFDVDTGLEGNFVNGFYESEDIRYGEANFGSPANSQSLLNLPNLKTIRIFLGDELFDLNTGRVEDYRRTLHMRDAVLERSLTWTSPGGARAAFEFRRFVSFADKNRMAEYVKVTSLNFEGKVKFESILQADVENHTRKTNPIVDYGPFGRRLEPERLYGKDDLLFYQGKTKKSGLTIACGCRHRFSGEGELFASAGTLDGCVTYETRLVPGQSAEAEKWICYTSDLDLAKEELEQFVVKDLSEAKASGYFAQEAEQAELMHDFWKNADVLVFGDDALQQGLRFNLFHIMQAAGRDGRTGMGAKGLTGEGYEGHYFWDTEMYVLPVFIYTQPKLAKKLLDYRYDTLEQARSRARILGHDKGALFPWRTINGEEASTYYPLGTAQYHINADISYALSLYLDVTGDVSYLKEKGAEILIETARVWADVGCFAECRGGKYCICDVTGPDEYNVLVDNNFYTNLMARENLRDAVSAVSWLKEQDPEVLEGLKQKLDFDVEETVLWEKIVENMYFPYDGTRDIYPMDDGFLMRKPWDESRIPPEKRAWLYENYHPLFIMRQRMSKQADAILGMYLHSDRFTKDEIRRNYDFYQEVTLHHSSLSTCIFGIVASEIGYDEEAYRYFSQSARMDLDDYHNNVYAGIHAANMAGTWQAIVNGFAGLRCRNGGLRFSPRLPEEWDGCSFCIGYRGSRLKVSMERERVTYTLLEGEPITFMSGEETVEIKETGGCYEQKL